MAQSYSLAVYAITINTRGHKNDLVVLSDFNNGQDLQIYIDKMIEGWKMDESRGDKTVPVNCDGDTNGGYAFRLSLNPDGRYCLYKRGRYLMGILETGDYGTQEDGVNITTGEVTFHKSSDEALMKPFFFMFHIPTDSSIGFLITERISNYGIMTVLYNAIINHFKNTPSYTDYVLKIKPLSVNELVKKKMKALKYEAKKIELRKVRKEDLQLSRLSGNTLDDQGVSTSIIYTAPRNSVIKTGEFINRLHSLRNNTNTFYIIDEDLSCDDILVTVTIDGKDHTLSLQNIQSLGMNMDITQDVKLGNNRYPTFESILDQANQLISYIKDQFEDEK